MGLVLDELEDKETSVIKENDVNIMYDGRLKNYFDHKYSITIDYESNKYGSGFIIKGGSSC